MNKCVVCDRSLKTGRKYCYEHRGTRNYNEPKIDGRIFFISFHLICIYLLIKYTNWRGIIMGIIWTLGFCTYYFIIIKKSFKNKMGEIE